MDSKEFISQAILTESPYTDETRQRLSKCVNDLELCLSDVMNTSEKLDNIKKYIYYGKEGFTSSTFEYNVPQEQVEKMWNKIRVLHAIIGLQTEIGELIEAFMNHIETDEELDVVNVKEEAGDQFYYHAVLANELNFEFESVWKTIINKLRSRYPNKFTSHDAIHRDLEAERKILES